MTRRARQRWSTRLDPVGSDDGMAVILVLFVIVMTTAFAVLVAGYVMASNLATRFNAKNVTTLAGAQAGLQYAVGQLRASSGVLSGLPCSAATNAYAFTGSVSPNAGDRYSVTVTYYRQDPSGLTGTALSSIQISCPSGYPQTVPAYAQISSQGTNSALASVSATAANRTLVETYIFNTTNQNIPGGPITLYDDGSGADPPGGLCLDATAAQPAPGTPVAVDSCVSGQKSQLWAYESDYSIALADTLSSSPLCLDAPYSSGVHSSNESVVLQPCKGVEAGATTSVPEQMWGYNGSRNFQATASNYQTSGNDGLDGFCLANSGYYANPGTLQLAGSGCGYNGTTGWIPSPAVGAGSADPAAGYSVGNASTFQQWVNYQEFGRCLDLTNNSINYRSNGGYFIDYPCKQAPGDYNNPGHVPTSDWNQLFAYAPAGPPGNPGLYSHELVLSDAYGEDGYGAGQYFCLISPLSSGQYVTINTMAPNPGYSSAPNPSTAPCPSSPPTKGSPYYWTYTGNTGDYVTSYQFQDSNGECLAVNPADTYASWSKVVVNACNSSLGQKWNAPANTIPSNEANVHETQ